jgi:hypothetical protein
MGAQSDASDDAESAAAPFERPEESGFEQALAILTSPSAVTISASNRLAAARP